MRPKVPLELLTLPLRTAVLLFLLLGAYYFGYDDPQLEWRKESPETGVIAKYSRNNRPWRTFYDRNLDRKWDKWVDERGGSEPIVSIDDNADGQPDRDEDESGKPISTWRASGLRAQKTFSEFIHNSRQVQFTGLALLLYVLLEFAIRWMTRKTGPPTPGA